MQWFTDFTVLEKVYFIVGCIFGLLLIVQIILLSVGAASGGDIDVDGDGEIDVEGDIDGGSFFTIRGMIAFFSVGAWVGLAASVGLPENLWWVSILIALAAGFLAQLGMYFAVRLVLKQQCSGTVRLNALVGKTATVYVSVPASRSGRGKVTLTAQGRYMELDAVTEEAERIPVDTMIEIVAMENECALVRTKPKESTE